MLSFVPAAARFVYLAVMLDACAEVRDYAHREPAIREALAAAVHDLGIIPMYGRPSPRPAGR